MVRVAAVRQGKQCSQTGVKWLGSGWGVAGESLGSGSTLPDPRELLGTVVHALTCHTAGWGRGHALLPPERPDTMNEWIPISEYDSSDSLDPTKVTQTNLTCRQVTLDMRHHRPRLEVCWANTHAPTYKQTISPYNAEI
ncbi:hypothetical protein RRG08_052350 [Elysia crispata]|uniref:Uncharacterized protein n=1 Tax=Elysia crispata TaxID=231223 RepID=A0AAE1DT84_9GAST|nr:hypothetical protein RRG08_052350 [Elysia crispata]